MYVLRVCGFVYYSSLRADGSAEFVILVVLDCACGVVCMMVVSLAAVSGCCGVAGAYGGFYVALRFCVVVCFWFGWVYMVSC